MATPPMSRIPHLEEYRALFLCKPKPLQKFALQHAILSDNISRKNFTPHNWARCMHNFINVYD